MTKAVDYFGTNPYLNCLNEFWICLCNPYLVTGCHVLVVVEKEVWKEYVDTVAIPCDKDGVPVGEVQIALLLKTTN